MNHDLTVTLRSWRSRWVWPLWRVEVAGGCEYDVTAFGLGVLGFSNGHEA